MPADGAQHPLQATPLPPADGYAALLMAAGRACAPRRRLTVSQWADQHRWLSAKASAEAGKWRTTRVPYLREIMDCLSDSSPVQRVVVMKSAQVGGTEIGLNWVGYAMHHAPCPMLVVVPTIEVRKRWAMQRLDPLLRETDVLAGLASERKRDSANGRDIKDFPGGGMLIMGGANSAASLASMPIRFALLDEIDRFKWELRGEGDPIGLIDERTKAFRRRKVLLVSTPTVKDASRVEEEWLASDQRHYHMPCPHCGDGIVFKWANLVWTSDHKHVSYACEHCGASIDEHHKPHMLADGAWHAEHPTRSTRGYHINGLMAPPGLGYTWPELVQQFQLAKEDPPKLKRFVNTSLGETWEDRSRDVQPMELQQRAEGYGLREIPPGALILTAGIDTQDDRLAVQLLGWGRGERCWALDWFELPGNPGKTELWAQVAEYLNRPLENAWGRRMYIEASGVDSGGHYTHEVYNWVRSQPARRVIAVKGANTPGRPVLAGRPKAVDVNAAGKTVRKGVQLWTVGTDTAKHALYNRLHADKTHSREEQMVHFSDQLPEEYYQQLTAESFDPERNKWVVKRGRRNEGVDTWVYAAAAAHHPALRVHTLRTRDWDALERQLQPDTPSDRAAAEQRDSAAEPEQRRKPRRRSQAQDQDEYPNWRI